VTLCLAGTQPLAVGHLRQVFAHPHDPDLIIKVMRPDAVAQRSARWHKTLARTLHYSGYVRELKEYIATRARFPHLEAPIARMVGVVPTDLGLGLVSEKVRAADGSMAPTLARRYELECGFSASIEQALREFLDGLLASNVIVGDMHAWNIVYGSDSRGGPRFVLIDGFGEKHFIPLASMSQTLNARNTHRLYRRMRAQVRREVSLPPV
jgi:hypothetical protein